MLIGIKFFSFIKNLKNKFVIFIIFLLHQQANKCKKASSFKSAVAK